MRDWRGIRFGARHVVGAVLAGTFLALLVASGEHLLRIGSDRQGVLEWLFPTPSAYPQVPLDELATRLAAIYGHRDATGEPTGPWSLDLDGCTLVLSTGGDRTSCERYPDSAWLSERRFDLRLVRTAPHSVEVRTMPVRRGFQADHVEDPLEPSAADRIAPASDAWGDLAGRLVRSAPGDGSDLPARMDTLRAFASTKLHDGLWRRFAETARYCTWVDVTGPPRRLFGEIGFFVAPGRGREFAELLHAYKVARCPFEPAALDANGG